MNDAIVEMNRLRHRSNVEEYIKATFNSLIIQDRMQNKLKNTFIDLQQFPHESSSNALI